MLFRSQLVKVYEHVNPVIKSVKQIADEEFKGDLKKAYYSYIDKVFRITNAQTSIRQRLLDLGEFSKQDLVSIKYIPSKGRNEGKETQLYYRGPSKELFAWLSDIVTSTSNEIVKLDNKGTLWDDIQYNNLTKEGGIAFSNGKKPIQIMMDIKSMVCKGNDIILDFFAGSSSTAHAVMQSNSLNGESCKFIMVQLPEAVDEKHEAYKAGYKTIAEISKERIRRAGAQILEIGRAHV